jgi:uncharacterized protein
MAVFERSFDLKASLDEVWNFHSDPVALTRITPKPIVIQVTACDYPVEIGSRVNLLLKVGPIGVRWNSIITHHRPMESFTDTQVAGQGPFKRWKHTHQFSLVPGGTRVTDSVEYEMPFGILGRIANATGARLMIAAMFSARERATRASLERSNR